MSSFFDELETQLRTAARERVSDSRAPRPRPRRRHRGWSWLRSGAALVPTLAAVAVAVVVAGGTLLLFGHRTHHQGGASTGSLQSILRSTPPAQLKREFGYIQAATHRVQQSRVCQTQQPQGPTLISGSPSADLLSGLGVLRRPATSADKINVLTALQSEPEQVYRGYVRRSLVAHGVSYYIVPVRDDRSGVIPSARCFALQEAGLRAYAPKIPTSMRAQTLAIQTGFIAYERRLVATTPRDRVCLVTVGSESGSDCGVTAPGIEAGVQPGNDNGAFSGIVPNGVGSVTLSFPAIKGAHAASLSGRVRGNMYAIQGPRAWNRYGGPLEPTMIWRSAQGQVIRTITPPGPEAAKQYCRAHPVPCVLIMHSTSEASNGAGYSGTTVAPVAPHSR